MGGKARSIPGPYEVAYVFRPDFFNFREDDVVARAIPFPGWHDYPLVLPEEVYMLANFGMLELAGDFPNNWEDWLVMSERMLACLLSVGHFAHKTTPVVMLDDRVGNGEHFDAARFDAEGKPLAQYMKTGWVFVELFDDLDIIDWERSDYERDTYDSSDLRDDPSLKDRGTLWKMVLRVPEEGLPPLFRVRGILSLCFVSHAAHEALEAMGAKGVRFRPLDQLFMTMDLPPEC